MSGNDWGKEGIRALALGQWDALHVCSLKHYGIRTSAADFSLAQVQFPLLCKLHLTGNLFETGALVFLGAAGFQWVRLRSVTLGLQDIDTRACSCDILVICHQGKIFDPQPDNFCHIDRRNRSTLPSMQYCGAQDRIKPSTKKNLINLLPNIMEH